MLKGKTIVLGVAGGIAAYKAAELTRRLVEAGAEVHVMMTKAAQQFVTPLTFQTLSGNPVHTDLFSTPNQMGGIGGRAVSPSDSSEPSGLASGERINQQIGHIALADGADLIVIAPATADLLARAAHGLCDDLITTVLVATRAPVLFAPSMNVHMWEHPITRENTDRLRKLGCTVLEPAAGPLACGTEGKGRLPETEELLREISKQFTHGRKFPRVVD